jgi:hypothetical protein
VNGLLLGRDQVALYPPAGLEDAHGWRLPGAAADWEGIGNLQLQPGVSDPRAAGGGGRGPHDPARDRQGTLYLPADAPVADGWTAVVRGEAYALSQVRMVADPLGGDGLDCHAATATGISDWPEEAGDGA